METNPALSSPRTCRLVCTTNDAVITKTNVAQQTRKVLGRKTG
jgi:hypothetical protein